MARSLNKVTLIGNLTRDPELRYTPQGTAVCQLGLATNRQWVTENGEKKEDVEFHKLVAWNKLAEICAQLLKKGRKIYVEGRLQTRTWQAQDGAQRSTTEIVISDMIMLDSRRDGEIGSDFDIPESVLDQGDVSPTTTEEHHDSHEEKSEKETKKKEKKAEKKEEVEDDEEIPF
jgi:single-strand DNA-binding protein